MKSLPLAVLRSLEELQECSLRGCRRRHSARAQRDENGLLASGLNFE